jgi:hypothetical protein
VTRGGAGLATRCASVSHWKRKFWLPRCCPAVAPARRCIVNGVRSRSHGGQGESNLLQFRLFSLLRFGSLLGLLLQLLGSELWPRKQASAVVGRHCQTLAVLTLSWKSDSAPARQLLAASSSASWGWRALSSPLLMSLTGYPRRVSAGTRPSCPRQGSQMSVKERVKAWSCSSSFPPSLILWRDVYSLLKTRRSFPPSEALLVVAKSKSNLTARHLILQLFLLGFEYFPPTCFFPPRLWY